MQKLTKAALILVDANVEVKALSFHIPKQTDTYILNFIFYYNFIFYFYYIIILIIYLLICNLKLLLYF